MIVSVIVAIYNIDKYITRCIDSILKSTYREIEVILVDDGSIDKCGKIIDEYACKDERIIAIHQSNMGLSMARNTAIDKASGECILIIDGDDYISDNMIELLVKNLGDNDYVESTQFFANDINIWRKKYQSNIKVNDFDLQVNKEACLFLALTSCGRLYRKKLFDNIRFPQGLVFEDNYFSTCLFPSLHKVLKLEVEKGYFHYQREGSITLTFNEKVYDMIPIQKLIIEYYKKCNLFTEYFEILEKNAIKALVISTLGRKMAYMDNNDLKETKYHEIQNFVRENYIYYDQNQYLSILEKKLAKYILTKYENVAKINKLVKLVKR